MVEKSKRNEQDWRKSMAGKIINLAKSSVLGQGIFDRKKPIDRDPTSAISFNEQLLLPSSVRLQGLFQHGSPEATYLLDMDITRGGHSEDVMRMTSNQFNRLLRVSSTQFISLCAKYNLPPEQAIEYFVEYMRLHDGATLAFHGATHNIIQFGGQGYNEDNVFIAEERNKPEYKIITDLLFDKTTRDYYSKRGLELGKLLEIAEDAVKGNTVIGQMLKKGKDHIPIDWLAYTVRDFTELMRVFNIDPQLPFPDIIAQVLKGLITFSDTLTDSTSLSMPDKIGSKLPIEQILPANIVNLIDDNSGIRAVYDAKSIYQVYLMHMVLRLFLSGAPWMRGCHRMIFSQLKQKYNKSSDDFIKRLLTMSETQILEEDLSDTFPLDKITHQMLSGLPKQLPQSVVGWSYGMQTQYLETVALKNIYAALMQTRDDYSTFTCCFPDLMRVINEVEKYQISQPLYLNKQNVTQT